MAIEVAVKPARAGMNLRHPVSGLLPDEGGKWLLDQFTAALIVEKSIVRVEDEPQVVAQPGKKRDDGSNPR